MICVTSESRYDSIGRIEGKTPQDPHKYDVLRQPRNEHVGAHDGQGCCASWKGGWFLMEPGVGQLQDRPQIEPTSSTQVASHFVTQQ